MEYIDVVKKLIGNINPVGESNTDADRFENLKNLCELANLIISDIDDMAYRNRNSHEASVKKAADYAKNYLTETIGISD